MSPELVPSKKSEGVLGLMIDRDGVQRTILEETLESEKDGQILESGRTMCNSQRDIKGPIKRFPRAVDLQQCPISGGGGAWHTHVTPDQLLNPENSLPDVSSVVFGQLDVIGVVGTESAEYVMASDDQRAMVREFRDAIGYDVSDQEELLTAVESGRINPRTARRRVRQRMRDLFVREDTGFDDLTEKVRARHDSVQASQQAYERIELAMLREQQKPDYASYMADPQACNEMASVMADEAAKKLTDAAKLVPPSVRDPAVGAAIGTVVGNVIDSWFFGE